MSDIRERFWSWALRPICDRIMDWLMEEPAFRDAVNNLRGPLAYHPRLSQRYGEANPGTTAQEKNLFAAGAMWWATELEANARPKKASEQ